MKPMLLSVILILTSVPSLAETPDQPSVLVQTVKLQQGSAPRILTAYGTVQSDPSASAAIVAPLAAVVGKLQVRTGMRVAKGAPLLLLVPSPQITAAYTQAVSALQLATSSLAHTRALLNESLATRQQLADAEKMQSDARAALVALSAQGAGGPTELRAPFNAIVTTVSTAERTLVNEGAALLELAPLNGLVLMAGVVPDQAAAIAPGDQVSVSPLSGTGAFRAKVALRGSVVDSQTGLVPVQISLPPGAFLPGQSARASITVGTVHGYVVAHQAVLIDDDGATYVVQIVGAVAKLVHVRVLGRQADNDTVDGPLDPQAPVVLAGNHQLQDGMKVRLTDTPGAGQSSR